MSKDNVSWTSRLRKHPWCLVIGVSVFAVTNVFWTTAFSLEGLGAEIASWVSIALAIVAITYTLLQGFSSHDNLARTSEQMVQMKQLIHDVPRIMRESVERLERTTTDFAEEARELLEKNQQDLPQVANDLPLGKDDGYRLNFMPYRVLDPPTLFVLYTIVKMYKSKASGCWSEITNLIYAKYATSEAIGYLTGHIDGIATGISCFLKPGSIERVVHDGKVGIQVVHLPDKLVDFVMVEVPKTTKHSAWLQDSLARIDKYIEERCV